MSLEWPEEVSHEAWVAPVARKISQERAGRVLLPACLAKTRLGH